MRYVGSLLMTLGITVFILPGCGDARGEPILSPDGAGGQGGSGGSAGSGQAGSGQAGGATEGAKASKVDLLFMVDNSASMADKQQVLSSAVPDLLRSLISPPCVDDTGKTTARPSAAAEACPGGSHRLFAPVADMHVGVVTSSLGGHGADICLRVEPSTPNQTSNNNFTRDDRARLINRGPRADATKVEFPTVPTYQEGGFLAWDANSALSPAGISDQAVLTEGVRNLVIGADQVGCGYEASLEGWYRFLVEPDPPEQIPQPGQVGDEVVPSGTDTALLAQRAAFLRPDSLVVVVMLTDEDDCSIIDGKSDLNDDFPMNYLLAQQKVSNATFHLKAPTSACQDDPYSPDCTSCYLNTSDPNCAQPLSDESDSPQLRCWDGKRRFGVDMLYPTSRYVEGLTKPQIKDRHGAMVANPLFASGRSPQNVILAAVAGVPWQDLAADPHDATAGYKSAGASGQQVDWELVLGDPFNPDKAKRHEAGDPLMRATPEARSGQLVTGETLGGVGSWNSINGHEWKTGTTDLQYACIFDLPKARDCATETTSCDCDSTAQSLENPLCEPLVDGKGTGQSTTTQRAAKAYPTPRILQVVHDVGSSGVLGSICAPQMNDPTRLDFGYHAVVEAILGRASARLAP